MVGVVVGIGQWGGGSGNESGEVKWGALVIVMVL